MTEKETHLTIGACIVSKGRVLLLKHAKLKKWLFPGGHIKPGETPDEAVVREVKEETGLDAELLDYGPIVHFSGLEVKKQAIPVFANVHSVGDHNHYCLYYLCSTNSDIFSRNYESDDMKWLSTDEIASSKEITDDIKAIALYCLKHIRP